MPSSRDLLNPGSEPGSLALQAGFFTTAANWEALRIPGVAKKIPIVMRSRKWSRSIPQPFY